MSIPYQIADTPKMLCVFDSKSLSFESSVTALLRTKKTFRKLELFVSFLENINLTKGCYCRQHRQRRQRRRRHQQRRQQRRRQQW